MVSMTVETYNMPQKLVKKKGNEKTEKLAKISKFLYKIYTNLMSVKNN